MVEELDVKRLLCPLPVIRTQNKVNTLPNGAELMVVGTDPGMLNDIPTWCRINGHQVLDTSEQAGEYRVHIRVQHSN